MNILKRDYIEDIEKEEDRLIYLGIINEAHNDDTL